MPTSPNGRPPPGLHSFQSRLGRGPRRFRTVRLRLRLRLRLGYRDRSGLFWTHVASAFRGGTGRSFWHVACRWQLILCFFMLCRLAEEAGPPAFTWTGRWPQSSQSFARVWTRFISSTCGSSSGWLTCPESPSSSAAANSCGTHVPSPLTTSGPFGASGSTCS